MRDCDDLSHEFLSRMAPLADRIGQLWLQLPARFAPQNLPALWLFLDSLPQDYRYGVEVRHPQFFARGDEERALNAGLHARGVNRVILDSRPVQSVVPTTPAFTQARLQKPKVPVHALVTARDPMIRFITSPDMAANQRLFADWIPRLQQWQPEITPWLFLHTPDMRLLTAAIDALWPGCQQACPGLPAAPALTHQISLL